MPRTGSAVEETLRMLDIYAEVAEDVMAMPVTKGSQIAGGEIRRRGNQLF